MSTCDIVSPLCVRWIAKRTYRLYWPGSRTSRLACPFPKTYLLRGMGSDDPMVYDPWSGSVPVAPICWCLQDCSQSRHQRPSGQVQALRVLRRTSSLDLGICLGATAASPVSRNDTNSLDGGIPSRRLPHDRDPPRPAGPRATFPIRTCPGGSARGT